MLVKYKLAKLMVNFKNTMYFMTLGQKMCFSLILLVIQKTVNIMKDIKKEKHLNLLKKMTL